MSEPKVVAALAWYDEPVPFLERLVASLAGVADLLVAFDGRWRLMPGDRNLSELEQTLAIQNAAAKVGLRCEIHGGGAPFEWPSQVAKRDELMRRAGQLGDWILVVDGDEHVEACDAAALRDRLDATGRDVAEVLLRTLNRPWPLSALDTMRTRTRRVYRAGTTVSGPKHYDYERKGRRLNGDQRLWRLEEPLDLTGVLTIAHDNRSRMPGRNAAAQTYRRARIRERAEAAA